MPVVARVISDATVLDLSGRFDAAAKATVQTAIDEALKLGVDHLIINLAGVPFVDSAAIGLLALTHQKFRQNGGRVSLINPQPEVRLILDMAAMPQLIPSYANLEEALQAKNAPAD